VPVIPGAGHLAAVVNWKPLAATTIATTTWLAMTVRPSALLLSTAAAGVAATTAYLLDDSATATLQSSPTTLLRRRAHRLVLALPLLGAWWALAVTIVSRSTAHLPLAAHTLQLAALVAIGLAGSSAAAKVIGGDARGSTAGALAVITCFGTAFLPRRSLQLLPVDPAAAGATRQLAVALAVAVAVLLSSSTDPARCPTLGQRPRRSPEATSAS